MDNTPDTQRPTRTETDIERKKYHGTECFSYFYWMTCDLNNLKSQFHRIGNKSHMTSCESRTPIG